MYLYKQILSKDNNVFTRMQDNVFPPSYGAYE